MGVRFSLVNWNNTGADFPNIYARLQQFSLSLRFSTGEQNGMSSPVALFYVSEAAFTAGVNPITVWSTGDLMGALSFPIADENALRAQLDTQLLAVVESLAGYVPGSGVIIPDPLPPSV